MKDQHIDTVSRSVVWGAITSGGAAAAASMVDSVKGLPFVAWTLGFALFGALVGLVAGGTVAYLDRRDEIRADATTRHMARMFEHQDDVKRRAA